MPSQYCIKYDLWLIFPPLPTWFRLSRDANLILQFASRRYLILLLLAIILSENIEVAYNSTQAQRAYCQSAAPLCQTLHMNLPAQSYIRLQLSFGFKTFLLSVRKSATLLVHRATKPWDPQTRRSTPTRKALSLTTFSVRGTSHGQCFHNKPSNSRDRAGG